MERRNFLIASATFIGGLAAERILHPLEKVFPPPLFEVQQSGAIPIRPIEVKEVSTPAQFINLFEQIMSNLGPLVNRPTKDYSELQFDTHDENPIRVKMGRVIDNGTIIRSITIEETRFRGLLIDGQLTWPSQADEDFFREGGQMLVEAYNSFLNLPVEKKGQ